MSEHFKQHSEGRGFQTPPHLPTPQNPPPPGISNRVPSFVSDVSGKSCRTKDRRGGGTAIFSELKIADFTVVEKAECTSAPSEHSFEYHWPKGMGKGNLGESVTSP